MLSKKIKSCIAILIMGVMIFTLAGCQQQSTSSDAGDQQEVTNEGEQGKEENKEAVEETKLDSIKKKGKIVLGTAADYPPYEFHKQIDGDDKIVGFDVEIAKAIAKDLGVEIEIKDMKFDGLLAALKADKIDFILAGMVPKPERKESVDFSIPYYQAEQKILIKAEDADKVKTVDDLKGFKIGAQKSTVQEEIALTKIPDAKVKSLSKITDLVLELKNNKVNGLVLVGPVAKAYADKNDDLIVPEISFGQEDGVAVAVNKGNTELLEEINKSLQSMLDKGQIDKFINEATMLAEEE